MLVRDRQSPPARISRQGFADQILLAKNAVIVAVDPRMAPLSPTGTALRAAFGRFSGIHAALLSMPVRPLGYRHGPTGRPSGRSSRRAAPCAALEQFQSEIALKAESGIIWSWEPRIPARAPRPAQWAWARPCNPAFPWPCSGPRSPTSQPKARRRKTRRFHRL